MELKVLVFSGWFWCFLGGFDDDGVAVVSEKKLVLIIFCGVYLDKCFEWLRTRCMSSLWISGLNGDVCLVYVLLHVLPSSEN